jgi:hypothetical protein
MKITVKQLRKVIRETVEQLEAEESDTQLREDEAVAEDDEGWLVPEGFDVSKLKSKKRK